jgi:hypothetical protein
VRLFHKGIFPYWFLSGAKALSLPGYQNVRRAKRKRWPHVH